MSNLDVSQVEDDHYDDDEDTLKDKYLTFNLSKEDYGIEIAYVTEIIGIQRITEVPDMPEFIKGVINLRGKVIPVVDVRARFKIDERQYDDRTCIIVVDLRDTPVGLVVDRVLEVTDIPENQIEPPPRTGNSPANRYLKGLGKMGDDVKILLDVEHLLYDSDLEKVAVAGNTGHAQR